MKNGNKIYANKVVSGVGVCNTFNKLVVNQNFKNNEVDNYIKLSKKIGSSTGFIYCFVNLEGSPKELELRDFD